MGEIEILQFSLFLRKASSNLKLATNKKLRFSVVDLAPPISYTAFSKIIRAFLTIITVVEFSRQRHHSAVKWLCPQKFGLAHREILEAVQVCQQPILLTGMCKSAP